MAIEVERKFLVTSSTWQAQVRSRYSVRQVYLALTDSASVRVRIVDDCSASMTVKSTHPCVTRAEFEYPIPVGDAEKMFRVCLGNPIEKTRHIVPAGGTLVWEVDVFGGALQGLVIAEIELPHANASFERPSWLGTEVTDDRRYYNSSLATVHR
ncbi:MAG: CYTH domain-containing protein [Terriglobia bacterium]|nr:CYTH domain-containing protein [Terriglobia bacterium]